MILTVPANDTKPFPTLGPQVVEWMHQHLVFGPGDLRGQPLELDAEQQAFIWKFYELFPKGHPHAGRRRFRRCALSLAKGLRKTELGAFVAIAELHKDAPVRFNGWRGRSGEPAPGRGVVDPFVILMAYSEEQSDELAFAAMLAILAESDISDDFDSGLERIVRKTGDGKAVSLAGSPNARDGARTTFQLFDETHRMTLDRLKRAHQTMMANLPKRRIADAWALELTTAYEPGAGSIAESTADYARAVEDGRVSDSSLFFFHRQAGDEHDLTTREGARAAVLEASGASAGWRDVEGILTLWGDPTTDRSYWARVWLNQVVRSSSQAFDIAMWRTLAKPRPVLPGALIVLGFDGAMFHDSTALVGTEIETGYQWVAGLWECPPGRDDWQVPAQEVDAVVRDLFDRFDVWRMYCDPPYWQSWIAAWSGAFGDDHVVEWWTNRRRPMTSALEGFHTAMREGTISHDGDKNLTRHLANAKRQDLSQRDEQGKATWLIRKERPDSQGKIDLAMAAVLSWECRTDAIAAGVETGSVYEHRGLLILGGDDDY